MYMCTYSVEYIVNPESKKKTGYAPFSSTVRLNRSVTKPDKLEKPNDFQQQRAFVIDDSNIQVMVQQRMNSMFKSRSQRIIQQFNNVPGPGSYELRSKYANNKQKISHKDKNLSVTQRKPNPPSIPTDNLGYKCTQDNKVEKVKPKIAKPPVPGSYQLRAQLIKDRGLSWQANPTVSRKQDDVVLPGPGAYTSQTGFNNKTATSCFVSESDRFNPKKIKKSYNPGPGQYQVEPNRVERQFSQTHFNSKSVRFPYEKGSNLGPGSYGNTNKSLKSFNKKILQGYRQNTEANRKTIFNHTNKNPGPGQYIARDGMTFQLQKALLRKHNFSQFPNSRREVFEPKQFDQPGPGAYEAEKPKTNPKGNIGYKKVDVINLKDETDDNQTPSPLEYTYNNFSMSKKVQQSTKRLTLTDKKPFNVGTQRFDHYANSTTKPNDTNAKRNQTYDTENNHSIDGNQQTSINFEGPKRVKKLIMTSVKVKVPFGTSTSKFEQPHTLQVGPGYYDSGNNWIKQSYSIKSKLNNK